MSTSTDQFVWIQIGPTGIAIDAHGPFPSASRAEEEAEWELDDHHGKTYQVLPLVRVAEEGAPSQGASSAVASHISRGRFINDLRT